MKNKKLLFKIAGATSAIVISFGVVFGLALAGKTKPYINFDDPNKVVSFADATPTETKWNISGDPMPVPFSIPGDDEGDRPENVQAITSDKYGYSALCIDGADHQVLDKSFNQSGYQGLVDWIWTDGWYYNQQTTPCTTPSPDFNASNVGSADGTQPTSNNTSDFWKTYATLIQDDHKSLVLPGYMHQSGLENFKKQQLGIYESAGYILLDANTPNDRNIASVMFRADEAAFMTGIATCQYLNDNFDEYNKDGKLSVGTFGGVNIPTVTIYMGGFEQGVIAWNKNIETIAENEGWSDPEQHKVNFINLGKIDSYFSNSFAIGDGKPLVQALLQRGADAILPVAGPQTIDAVKEIQAYKSNCVVVGVDTAQELDNNTNGRSSYTDTSGDSNVIKFSATKNIANITSQILSLSYAGSPNDSEINDSGDIKVGSYGYLTVGDTSNDGISPSAPALPYLQEFIQNVLENPLSPEDDLYQWVLDNLSTNFPLPNGDLGNYFEWLSREDNMVFRI